MSQINRNLEELLENNVADFNGLHQLMSETRDISQGVFDKQVIIGQRVNTTYNWFKSAEGKQAMEYVGIVMDRNEFISQVVGDRSWFYELIAIGKVREESPNLISEYKESTENRSVRGCLKFIKNGGAESEETESESESASTTLMTFSAKAEALESEKGASLRLLSDGKIEGVNARSIEALEMLLAKAKEQLNA
jgi:hypothetical protein